jgi:phosphoribosylformylglycinamidine synthase
VRVRDGDAVEAEISAALLSDGAPAYEISGTKPEPPAAGVARFADPAERLLSHLASANGSSRERIYRRYDQMVGVDTVVGPGADAAVLRLKGRRDGIALALDANVDLGAEPFLAAAASVAEACRNLVCVGARPLGLTDCVNAGNPERATGAWQLTRTIDGLAAAARALDVPFVSGNVSLYNASGGRDIVPTAVVGAVGQLDDVARAIPAGIGHDGETLVLLGGLDLDLAREARLQRAILDAHEQDLVSAAHDPGEGGVAVALAEMALRGGSGARVRLVGDPFARALGAVVVATRDAASLERLAARHDVPTMRLGVVGGAALRIDDVLEVLVSELDAAYRRGLPEALGLGR